jgi:hypothetical protein
VFASRQLGHLSPNVTLGVRAPLHQAEHGQRATQWRARLETRWNRRRRHTANERGGFVAEAALEHGFSHTRRQAADGCRASPREVRGLIPGAPIQGRGGRHCGTSSACSTAIPFRITTVGRGTRWNGSIANQSARVAAAGLQSAAEHSPHVPPTTPEALTIDATRPAARRNAVDGRVLRRSPSTTKSTNRHEPTDSVASR